MTGGSATSAASGSRAVWLLTHLRLQRLANQMALVYTRRVGGRTGRPATAGKKRNRWVVSAVVGFFMLFAYGTIARQSIINLHRALDPLDASRFATPSGPFSEAMTRGLAMEWSLLFASPSSAPWPLASFRNRIGIWNGWSPCRCGCRCCCGAG